MLPTARKSPVQKVYRAKARNPSVGQSSANALGIRFAGRIYYKCTFLDPTLKHSVSAGRKWELFVFSSSFLNKDLSPFPNWF